MGSQGDYWPEHHECAVSLTFDDGRSTQLDCAVPLLNERGLKGTFYLCARDDYREALAAWRRPAAEGHEIGNHSVRHVCSRNFCFDPKGFGLETCSLDTIREDIVEAQRRLGDLFGSAPQTFCYPCYQTDVGEGATRQSYVPVVAENFIAARAGGEYGFFNHPLLIDLHCLWSCDAARKPGSELIGLVELAARQRRWIVLTFHDVGPARLGTSEFDFTQLLDHLAGNADRIWTATVAEAAQHCLRLRQAGKS